MMTTMIARVVLEVFDTNGFLIIGFLRSMERILLDSNRPERKFSIHQEMKRGQ